MAPPKVLISYWADSELAFVYYTRARCLALGIPFEFRQISHHASWFGAERSIIKNAIHLAQTLIDLLRKGFAGNVCAFGTNVSRALFFFSWLFRRTYYIYNELPEHRSSTPLYWIDKIIFRHARLVYVSSDARAQFVKKLYNLRRDIGVVENITFLEIPDIQHTERRNGAVFAGSITPKRFNSQDIQKFRTLRDFLGKNIVVYGVVARELSPEFASLLDLRGTVPHAEIMQRLAGFRYALLSYYQGEPNYDLCAPLKLYEYVAAGCRVISINRNIGLLQVAERYPNLISFLDDSLSAQHFRDELAFAQEREAFLREALMSNERLAMDITT